MVIHDLKTKLLFLREKSNEFSLGWNDSGCFWHFCWGKRGAGSMIGDIGETFSALEIDDDDELADCDIEKAVDALLAHRGLTAFAISAWLTGRGKS